MLENVELVTAWCRLYIMKTRRVATARGGDLEIGALKSKMGAEGAPLANIRERQIR